MHCKFFVTAENNAHENMGKRQLIIGKHWIWKFLVLNRYSVSVYFFLKPFIYGLSCKMSILKSLDFSFGTFLCVKTKKSTLYKL